MPDTETDHEREFAAALPALDLVALWAEVSRAIKRGKAQPSGILVAYLAELQRRYCICDQLEVPTEYTYIGRIGRNPAAGQEHRDLCEAHGIHEGDTLLLPYPHEWDDSQQPGYEEGFDEIYLCAACHEHRQKQSPEG